MALSLYFQTNLPPKSNRDIERSLDIVAHRGPHGRGVVLGRGSQVITDSEQAAATWGLGHVRLAIVDLTPAGNQPMAGSGMQHWITYNGEIYNHVELRAELAETGYRFRSTSDTEVILAAYSVWGADCVEKFNGMFAFVLVDLDKKTVLVARDRLGVKPMYMWQGNHMTVLVSEPKQLIGLPGFQPRGNKQQIVDFLIDGVLSHDPGQCCFEGVYPAPPGHQWSWQLAKVSELPASRSYWEPHIGTNLENWNEAVEKTRVLLTDAVRIRLRSDVPVGSCLSGGLDSSVVVGLASAASNTRMKTFSSCFHDRRFDESRFSDAVNEKWGLQGTKVYPDSEGLMVSLDQLVYHQDEPFTSASIYAQWCLMQAVGTHNLHVLLDGQGGDEALCGYRNYALFYLRFLLFKQRYIEAAEHLIGLLLAGDRRLLDWRLGLRYVPEFLRKRHDDFQGLMRPSWSRMARHIWYEQMKNVKEIHEHQWADLRQWSLPSLLRYEDRNSMAHGIETRLPFLDYRFLEHCLSLQESFFFRKGHTKRIVVQALGDLLPQSIKARRTKMGFDTPSEDWMKGEFGRFLEMRVRSSERLSSILDPAAAGEIFRAYRHGKKSFSDRALFRIAILAVWLDVFKVDV